jgi:hypothetical protein
MGAARAGGISLEPPAGRPCYLLPLRWQDGQDGLGELTGYLCQIARHCDVVVVDGSPEPVFARHDRAWAGIARHIRPDQALACRNGKVSGVITGIRSVAAGRVVIADDDVRYDEQALSRILALLDRCDLVIPQNYFDPLPWHAAWDSARSLINRALGTDYPGTVAVRRQAFLAAGCYDGDVLFENLELMRTLRAAGARISLAPDLFVRRLPPSTRQFLRQRIRQAYDSLAQPPRLAAELALLPAALLAARSRRPWVLASAAAATVGVAEAGRRRHAGTAVFPRVAALLAPAWLTERAACSWLAVALRLRGGIRYGGRRITRAAHSAKVLNRAHGRRPAVAMRSMPAAEVTGRVAQPRAQTARQAPARHAGADGARRDLCSVTASRRLGD